MDDKKLMEIALKWNIPLSLLESLIKATNNLSLHDRKVGQLTVIEEIIYNFLKEKNDN
jgi:hypothetical protein